MTNPICSHCGEPVTGEAEWLPHMDQDGTTMRARHPICGMRAVIGGLNHLKGLCTCCGGSEPPDPPELSRYEAALAAVRYYQWRAKRG